MRSRINDTKSVGMAVLCRPDGLKATSAVGSDTTCRPACKVASKFLSGNIPLKETSYEKTRSHFDGRYVRTGTDCIVCQCANSAARCGKHADAA